MKFIKNNKTYILWAIITLAAGVLSALTAGNFGAYSSLIKPPLSPPGFLFPVVWTALYILTGIAAGIVAESRDLDRGNALKLYILQLFVNFLWPVIFFRFRAAKFALFWLVLLVIVVLATYKSFKSISSKASSLLIPYIVWLLFAFYLNFGIIILNS